uniref:Leiomodin-3 n=1 Tax=Callorhinchus milii TaxID=7868 RepID=A0A4W3HF55_CALMI|eukprot:gi/632955295/ref/XP_007893397.1/ PREDICTED: leiomodin-3 [Callorhinchus milii]
MSEYSNDSGQEEAEGSMVVGDLEEDEILATLSAEELKQLQSEMDDLEPDLQVPIGHRQRDQTARPPTGSFNHRSLIDYIHWEKETSRILDEERVPVNVAQQPVQNITEALEELQAEEKNSCEQNTNVRGDSDKLKETVQCLNENSQWIQQGLDDVVDCREIECKPEKEKEMLGRLKTQQSGDQRVTEPVLNAEENIRDAHEISESSNSDHSPLQQPIMEQKNEDTMTVCNKPEPSSSTEDQSNVNGSKEENKEDPTHVNESQENAEKKIAKIKTPKKLGLDSNFLKLTARPSGNPTLLDESLNNIRKNKADLKEINLNNIENVPKDMLLEFVEALKKNKHITTFSIANTGADENVAFALANMLRENKKIVTLNIESNFITGKGIVAIMRCLQFNETLNELRFHNQRHMLGHHAEMEIARLLKANTTLLKLGYHFELPGPRMVVTNLLTRNLDQQRKKRLEEQRNQSVKEQGEMMESLQNLPPGLLEMLSDYMPGFAMFNKHPTHPSLSFDNFPENNSEASQVKLQRTSKMQNKAKADENGTHLNEKANLKDMIKTLKPVPRGRQAPLVQETPRDQLLNDIRHSNVAYLKSVQLPNILN